MNVPRSGEGGSSCHSLSLLLSDSADVSQASSDMESEEKEDQMATVTSMDEALRTVSADHSEEDFLKQNFETLAESCSAGRAGKILSFSLRNLDKMSL